MKPEEAPGNKANELTCDYLVVGAGCAGMSFVDTLITESKTASVIIVDRNNGPGGHWTKAYPFVRLHQPSCYYGVNSLPLGKNRNCRGKERYDMYDRATGAEVVDYYKEVCENFKKTGRVKIFFDSEYTFDEGKGVHTIVQGDGSDKISVTCGKLVTVHTDVKVPGMRKEPLIPVDKRVNFVPVNQVPTCLNSGKYKKYIVFGNGKTGVDAVIHLLDSGVDQSQIQWIVPRDVWYFIREGFRDFFASFDVFGKAILTAKSVEEYVLTLEKHEFFGRLDPSRPFPKVTKGATIDMRELQAIRTIQNVVRMGRATSIQAGKVVLEKGSLDFTTDDTLLVDCMALDLYGYLSFSEDFTIFEPGKINLGPGYGVFNPSYSYAHTAFLECNLDDDASKNDCCYFVKGEHGRDLHPAYVIGLMYIQTKTFNALQKVKGGAKFMLASRTNAQAPYHHKGGMLRLLWFLFGPSQGAKFGDKLIQKVESKGFSDLHHCFGVETFGSKDVEAEV
eukprot:CAMPEP_0116133362 /NCGR_PEP_ID=MMETSP0329-20121206/10063_1 /TAXON_ID=697910 /ORGANISM="Pseudo-nitzschia arenysensis, Strain B593" /LENGTH=503 /DNA_ID=CAMNT_0003627983 /DNA_START=156 /DNA_END=1667 /DNA_ORIENTATION=+